MISRPVHLEFQTAFPREVSLTHTEEAAALPAFQKVYEIITGDILATELPPAANLARTKAVYRRVVLGYDSVITAARDYPLPSPLTPLQEISVQTFGYDQEVGTSIYQRGQDDLIRRSCSIFPLLLSLSRNIDPNAIYADDATIVRDHFEAIELQRLDECVSRLERGMDNQTVDAHEMQSLARFIIEL